VLKKILTKIFPRVFLKKAHLRYNTLRINTIDKILFAEHRFAQQDFVVRRDAYPFRITTVRKDHLDARLQHQISLYENWTQDEYLLVYERDCIIEPKHGWALSTDNKLIYPSLGFSRATYLPKPALEALWKRNEELPTHEVLVSLRDTGEENYYHFYNDVLAKLFFLEEKLNLPYDTPLLIAEVLYKKSFFQYFLQHPYLKNRNWVIQREGEYIRSKKTYFCKPLTHTAHYYDRIRELVRPEDLAPQGGERRIFITRSPQRLRFIENNAEIEALCRAENFEVVDFDTITLSQQIQLLSQSRYVIGIHGAGLFNMMFRGHQAMGLLEVFPPGEYYPFHYMLMASQLGYQYDSMIGEPGHTKYSGGFYVPPAEFKQRMMALLAQA
jgi:hypothetical protein